MVKRGERKNNLQPTIINREHIGRNEIESKAEKTCRRMNVKVGKEFWQELQNSL